MNSQPFVTTTRLIIEPLRPADADFIFELVNSEGWIRFIGNRNVASKADAAAYIDKILANNSISYWVVKLKNALQPVGIITYIQRDYLSHPDIGFAFLPQCSGHGYAFEAASAVLNKIIRDHHPAQILATTLPENTSSIKLLQKLGLTFQKALHRNDETLHLYATPLNP